MGLMRFGGVMVRFSRTACTFCFFMMVASLWCHAADVVFVRPANGSSAEQQELQTATRFYGVDLLVIAANGDTDSPDLARAVERKETLAVVVAADALSTVNKKSLLQSLSQRAGSRIPMLILGVTPATDPELLKTWTGDAAVSCRRLDSQRHPGFVVRSVAGITRQLSGLELPFSGKDISYFAFSRNSKEQEIMAVRDKQQLLPTFIRADVDDHEIFVSGKISSSSDNGDQLNTGSMLDAFAAIAPTLMFIRYSVGDWGWHAIHHYANLTIDDPWLREPYGYLNYKDLLAEMEKHDFHTTIAFIPWNYDRSQAEVASLFRNHPDRFSISIHGDNHDHQEFPALNRKSLALQTADLQQSLSRMARFQELTGIPYDRVMIFPHNIGSQSILEALKADNFLATINSSNVPLDGVRPLALSFELRPVTLSWADFPSISRFPAGMPNPIAYIAINTFLDNPLLFYGHHDLFASGIAAFDPVADEVNKLEPDTRWRGLGDIVKHLYLIRLRSDSSYDVLAFSNSVSLENTSIHQSTFYIRRQEAGPLAIASVAADGQPILFRVQDGYLEFSIAVPAGKTCNIAIAYNNDGQGTSIAVLKSSLRVYLLRMASDFRDITMSQYTLSRPLVSMYYGNNISATLLVIWGFALIAFCGCVGVSLRAFVARKRSS